MMYPGDDPRPGDQAADTAMKALFRELDQHDLPADSPFDSEAGFADLTRRLRSERNTAAVAADTVELDRADSAHQAELGQLRQEHEVELVRIQAEQEVELVRVQAEYEMELALARSAVERAKNEPDLSYTADRWDPDRSRRAYRAGGLFLAGIGAVAAAAMALIVLAHTPAVAALVAVIGAVAGTAGVLVHRAAAAAGGALARHADPLARAEPLAPPPRQTAEPSSGTHIRFDRVQGGQITINDTPADPGGGSLPGRNRLDVGILVLVLALAVAAGGTAAGTVGVMTDEVHLTAYQVILAAAAGAGVVIAAALYKYRYRPATQPPPGPPKE